MVSLGTLSPGGSLSAPSGQFVSASNPEDDFTFTVPAGVTEQVYIIISYTGSFGDLGVGLYNNLVAFQLNAIYGANNAPIFPYEFNAGHLSSGAYTIPIGYTPLSGLSVVPFSLTITTTLPNVVSPTVTAQNFSVPENQSVGLANASQLTLANPNGDNLTSYWIEDLGGGSGHLTVGGVVEPNGTWIQTNSTWSNVQYVGGGSPGTDTLNAAVFDSSTGQYVYASTFTAITTTPQTNSPPVAKNDIFSVPENGVLAALAPGVLFNDTDDGGINNLTAVLSGGPTHGSLSFHTDGSFTYTPYASYAGSDSFTYKANDGQLDSINAATVSIAVTAIPLPDLLAVSSNFSYTTLNSAGGITYSYWADNFGTALAPASKTGIYLSGDGHIDASDVLLAVIDTPALPALSGGNDFESVGFGLPTNLSPGTYWIGAIVDYNGQIPEGNSTNTAEANNASNSLPIVLGDNNSNTLTGTSGDDAMLGFAGNDTLSSGPGNDVLIGGTGFDTLTGGPGKDTFVFEHPSDGAKTITDVTPGQDVIQLSASGFGLAAGSLAHAGVSFVTGTAAITSEPSVVYDIAGNIYWDPDGTGAQPQVALANVGSAYASSSLGGNTDWQVVATGDFNHDGTGDIIWRSTSSGQDLLWLMNNGQMAQTINLGGNTDWSPVATGDFNHDGTSDIVWRSASSGQDLLWTMGTNGQPTSTTSIGGNLDWKPVATGDFNHDGTSDIIWRSNSSGQDLLWLMNNGQMTQTINLGGNTDWQVAATGDFNHDGTTDIVWRSNSSGQDLLWIMGTNGQPTSTTNIGGNLDWRPVATGDFNGDGTSDIIWRSNGSGTDILWTMANGQPTVTQVIGGNTDWSPVATGDFNHNGADDIVWHSVGSGADLLWSMGFPHPAITAEHFVVA